MFPLITIKSMSWFLILCIFSFAEVQNNYLHWLQLNAGSAFISCAFSALPRVKIILCIDYNKYAPSSNQCKQLFWTLKQTNSQKIKKRRLKNTWPILQSRINEPPWTYPIKQQKLFRGIISGGLIFAAKGDLAKAPMKIGSAPLNYKNHL